MALVLQIGEREHHVGRTQRRAIVKARLRPQRKGEDAAIIRDRNTPCDKAVHGVRLVKGADHQRIVDDLEANGRIPALHQRVERVEGGRILVERPGRRHPRKASALRRLRIDIGQLLETRPVGEGPENRQAVLRGPGGIGIRTQRQGCGERKGRSQRGPAAQNIAARGRAACRLRQTTQLAASMVAALSASHHQASRPMP